MDSDGYGIHIIIYKLNNMKEFKKFISRGNVIDMAVGLILATYFGAIIKSLVNDIRLNGVKDYVDFKEDDFVEDFENYMSDRMDS